MTRAGRTEVGRDAASAQDEASLVARLKAGDQPAFEEMVRLYGPRLLAVARRLMQNEDDALDALQDGLLSATKNIARFEGGSRLSTWLHRIVVNAALMRMRTRKRRPEASIEDLLPRFRADGHHLDPPAPWESPTARLESREVRLMVRAAIDQLPEAYRNVLILRDIEGLDTAATAAALGVTENAVKTRLHRARQALRALLDPSFRNTSP